MAPYRKPHAVAASADPLPGVLLQDGSVRTTPVDGATEARLAGDGTSAMAQFSGIEHRSRAANKPASGHEPAGVAIETYLGLVHNRVGGRS